MTPILYNFGYKLRHTKSGEEVQIIRVPDDNWRLEYCDEPFYAYRATATGVVWFRSKSEMEDGRFVPIAEANKAINPPIQPAAVETLTLPGHTHYDVLSTLKPEEPPQPAAETICDLL